jgi:hypothetical protein
VEGSILALQFITTAQTLFGRRTAESVKTKCCMLQNMAILLKQTILWECTWVKKLDAPTVSQVMNAYTHFTVALFKKTQLHLISEFKK